MSDKKILPEAEELLELAVRHVRSPEGAKHYGLPIGSVITADIIAAVDGLKGKAPKGSLTSGAKNHGSSKRMPSAPGPVVPGGPKQQIGGPKNPAKPFPAVKLKSKPELTGNNHFKVGETDYSAPSGSKLFTAQGGRMAYVLTSDGKIHAFNANGQIEIPSPLDTILAKKFAGDISNDPNYKAAEFDTVGTSFDSASLPVGSVLNDKTGAPAFKKIGDQQWQSTTLGAKLSEDDIKPLMDSGDLVADTSTNPDVAGADAAFNKTDKTDFASMSAAEFDQALGDMPSGQVLSMKAGADGKPNSTTFVKQDDGTWKTDAATIATTNIYHFKTQLVVGQDKPAKPDSPVATEVGPQKPTASWIGRTGVGSQVNIETDTGGKVTWNKTGPDEWSQPGDHTGSSTVTNEQLSHAAETSTTSTFSISKSVTPKPGETVPAPVEAKTPTERPKHRVPKPGSKDYPSKATEDQLMNSKVGDKVLVSFDAQAGPQADNVEYVKNDKLHWVNPADASDTIGPGTMAAIVSDTNPQADEQAFWHANNTEPGQVAPKGAQFGPGYKMGKEDFKAAPVGTKLEDGNGNTYTKVNDVGGVPGKDTFWEKDFGGPYMLSVFDDLMAANSDATNFKVVGEAAPEERPVVNPASEGKPTVWSPTLEFSFEGVAPGDGEWTAESTVQDIENAKPGDQILKGYDFYHDENLLTGDLPSYEPDNVFEKQDDGSWKSLAYPQQSIPEADLTNDILSSDGEYTDTQYYTKKDNSTKQPKQVVGTTEVAEPGKGHFAQQANVSDINNAQKGDVLLADNGNQFTFDGEGWTAPGTDLTMSSNGLKQTLNSNGVKLYASDTNAGYTPESHRPGNYTPVDISTADLSQYPEGTKLTITKAPKSGSGAGASVYSYTKQGFAWNKDGSEVDLTDDGIKNAFGQYFMDKNPYYSATIDQSSITAPVRPSNSKTPLPEGVPSHFKQIHSVTDLEDAGPGDVINVVSKGNVHELVLSDQGVWTSTEWGNTFDEVDIMDGSSGSDVYYAKNRSKALPPEQNVGSLISAEEFAYSAPGTTALYHNTTGGGSSSGITFTVLKDGKVLSEHGSEYTVDDFANFEKFELTGTPALPETNVDALQPGDQFLAHVKELNAFPLGTVLQFDGGYETYTKNAEGDWVNVHGKAFVPEMMAGGGEQMKFIGKPKPAEDIHEGDTIGGHDLVSLPVGAVITAGPTGQAEYTKQDNGDWKNTSSQYVYTAYQVGEVLGMGDKGGSVKSLPSFTDPNADPQLHEGSTFGGHYQDNVPVGTKFHGITLNGDAKHEDNWIKIGPSQYLNESTSVAVTSLPNTAFYKTDSLNNSVSPLADWELELLDSNYQHPTSTAPSNSATGLDVGGASLSTDQLKEAITALESHSGFQVKYGLKSLPDDSPLQDESIVNEIKNMAAEAFPGDKPKPAFIKFLKSKLGVQSGSDPITNEKNIHFGSNDPKSTIQGFDGGDFSAADLTEAIGILESYDGKLFKSELNKKGNALGSLDPIKIVGFDKDKLVTKQKFIDLLKTKLSDHLDKNPLPEAPVAPGFPTLESASQADALEVGSIITFDSGKVFQKLATGEWKNPDDAFSIPTGSLAAGIEAGTIHVTHSEDSLGNLQKAMEDIQVEDTTPDVEAPLIISKQPGTPISGTDAFYNSPIGTTVVGTTDQVPGLINYFTKVDEGVWQLTDNGKGYSSEHPYTDYDMGTEKYLKFESYSKVNTLPADAQTPEAVQAATNNPTTGVTVNPDEIPNLPIGAVLKPKNGNHFYTKTDKGWVAINTDTGKGSGFAHPDGSLQDAAKEGNLEKVLSSDPNFNQSGLLPGKYSNGNAAYMIVHADGTGTYVNTKGEGKNLTAAAVVKNHDAGMKLYGGIVDGPETSAPKAKAAAAPKVAPKTYEDIPDGTYFGGLPNNPKSVIYTVKDGKVTAKKPLGSSPETTAGWYTSGNKIGQEANKNWMDIAAVGATMKTKFSKKETVAYKAPDGWHLTVDDSLYTGTPSYSWVVGGHGYADEEVAFPKSKLQTMFGQGELLDANGNSIVPEGYSGGLVYFGAPTTVQNLLEAKKEFDANPDSAAGELLHKHGIMFDPQLTNKYIKTHHTDDIKTKQEHQQDFLKSTLDDAVKGVDTTIPESDASKLFDWDSLGNAVFPQELVTMSTYSAPDKTAYIKLAQTKFGGIVGQHYNKMTADQKQDWITYLKNGNFAAMYNIEVAAAAKDGKPHATGFQHPGYEGNTGTNKITWGAAVKGEIPAGTKIEGEWTTAYGVQASLAEIDNYMIKAQMQYPTFLTNSEKRNWVKNHQNGQKDSVDHLSVTAKQRKEAGASPLSEPLSWTDDIVPAKSYDALFDNTEFPQSWSNNAAKDFIDDNPDNKELQALYQKNLNEHGTYYGAQYTANEYFANKKALDDAQKLIPVYTLDTSKTIKKSTHPVFPYTDQFGKKYFFKPAYPNKLGKYRTEVEHFGNQFGKLFGFGTAHSELVTIDGKYGQLQQDVGGVGELINFDYSTLTSQQIADIGNEHLLDWFLDNDDTHGDNAKILGNGHIVGIDKGRAFKHFGVWKGLSGNDSMNSNAQTIFSRLYDTIRGNKLDKKDVDAAYLKVQLKAKKMAKVPDEKITAMLAEAMANREDYHVEYKINGKSVSQDLNGLTAAVLDRKNKLPQDIEDMWKKIYKDAGYGDLPEVPAASLGEIISGLDHTKLHEEVFQAHASGKATMLAGAHIIGGTALVWTEKTHTDETNVKGEMFLGPKKQKELLNYFISNATDNSGSSPVQAAVGFGVYDTYGDGLTSMSKTVNHHSADGEYNPSTKSNYEQIKKNMLSDIAEWTPNLTVNASTPNGDDAYKFQSGNIVPTQFLDQYKLMLNHYAPQIEKIDASVAAQGKVEHMTKFEPLKLSGKNKKFTNSDGSALTELANKKYIWTNADGDVSTVSASEDHVKSAIAGEDGWSPIEISVPETPVSNVIITKNSSTHEQEADFNPETNVKKLKTSNVGSGTNGQEYQVTLPTGEIIYWRNSGQTNTAKGQQGKLSFVIPNTEDPSAVAESMQRIREQLDNMGIPTDAADPASAELTYWREMYGVLENRSHKNKNSKKYGEAYDKMKVKIKALGGDENEFLENLSASMTPEEEIQYWRDLYSEFWPEQVDNLIENEGYLPKFDHQNFQTADLETGRPYWERFDISVQDLLDKKVVLAHSTGNDGTLEKSLESGALLGGEERIRQLGSIYTGGGFGASSALHDQQNGSSHQIYTRILTDSSVGGYNVIMHPKALLRTRTYSLGSDNYGNLLARKDGSPSNPLDAIDKFKDSGGNETMLPNMSSLLDQIEVVGFESAAKRNALIQKLKKLGIEEIRGVPVEDRLVMNNNMQAAIQKLRAVWQKELAD